MTLGKHNIKKIAILRALQLGDLLCAVPAMRALRHAYPDAEITLFGLPWAASFVERFNKYFDRFIHFPGFKGLPEQDYDPQKFTAFVQTVQNEHFDVVLQMQGNGTIVNAFLPLFKAAYMAGYYNDDSYKPSELFMQYPNFGNEITRHLKLMEFLGATPVDGELEFPLTEKDRTDFEELCVYLPAQQYVCVHPGSRGRWRQWPPKYFAALADICIEQGYTVVVTGTKDEEDITGEMIKCMRHAAVDLTGATSVGAVAILLQGAYLLIANCTGVSHIAAAIKTPSLIISMDGEPGRWGPLNRHLHIVIDCRGQPRFNEVLVNLHKLLRTDLGFRHDNPLVA
jgi:ADP-heptose:LPS heptosyltransferase